MKKYLLGLFAVVLAVGFSSFTLNKARLSTTFIYTSQSFLQGDVQNLENWEIGEPDCSDNQNKPCTFTVSDAQYVSGSHPANVTIMTSGSGNNYVLDVRNLSSVSVASDIVNKN